MDADLAQHLDRGDAEEVRAMKSTPYLVARSLSV